MKVLVTFTAKRGMLLKAEVCPGVRGPEGCICHNIYDHNHLSKIEATPTDCSVLRMCVRPFI